MMKKLADKKRRAAAGAMQDMRLTMAKKAIAAVKMGDASLCKPSNPTADKIKYCNSNFDTDPDLNRDCKDPEQYCMMCCENEIGLKYAFERAQCLKECGTMKKNLGNWVWVPQSNEIKI